MEKPQLKTPPQPEYAFMDLDAVLFAAASAGEQVIYTAVDEDGNDIGSFTSAKAFDNWITECEVFGLDVEFGFAGDFSKVTRRVDYEIKDFKECTKAFDSVVKRWFKQSGCKHMVGYISKASGEENFRYDVATVKPYKGNRKESRKPHYLEELRKYVRAKEEIKVPRGPVEVDDVVCAMAQKKRYKGCVIGVDKDARGVQDTHILIPDEMKKPIFSSNKIVGRLYRNEANKIVGYGTLFWLYQALAGDPVDGIPGCKGIGENKAYDALCIYDEVSSKYLKDAIKTVLEVYVSKYGDGEFTYKHHTSKEELTILAKDIFIEMSTLVYMKKSQKDECFWIPLIEEVWGEMQNENDS